MRWLSTDGPLWRVNVSFAPPPRPTTFFQIRLQLTSHCGLSLRKFKFSFEKKTVLGCKDVYKCQKCLIIKGTAINPLIMRLFITKFESSILSDMIKKIFWSSFICPWIWIFPMWNVMKNTLVPFVSSKLNSWAYDLLMLVHRKHLAC